MNSLLHYSNTAQLQNVCSLNNCGTYGDMIDYPQYLPSELKCYISYIIFVISLQPGQLCWSSIFF